LFYADYTENILRAPDDNGAYRFEIGDELEIEMDELRNTMSGALYASYATFNKLVNRVSKSASSTNVITTRGSSSNMVISPGALNAMNSPNAMEIARRLSEMVDATGKEYEFKIEDPGSKFTYSLICRK